MDETDIKIAEDPHIGIKYLGYLIPDKICTSDTFRMRISLLNNSRLTLSSQNSIFFSYRWLPSMKDEDVIWGQGLWTKIDNDILPHQKSVLYPLVLAPENPGDYILEFDFVHDKVAWFHDRGNETLRISVNVETNPRSIRAPKSESIIQGLQRFIKRYLPSFTAKDYFLIVGVQRSGTSVVHVNVSKHPQIECLTGELKIAPLFTSGVDTYVNTPCDTGMELEYGWKEIFKAITSLNVQKETRLCGAKIAVDDAFSAKRLLTAIGRTFPELKIVFIERRDKVAQFGSWQSARSTGVYCSKKDISDYKTLEIDEDDFRHYVTDCMKTNRELLRLAETNPLHACYYEELLKDKNNFMAEIYDFLGVKPITFQEELKKLLPPPRQYIVNYDAMCKVLEALGKNKT